MANTVYAGRNASKWTGVRPAIIGEQILRNGSVNNGTTIIYTVPADKTLLLFDDITDMWWSAVGASEGKLFIRDAADVTVFTITYVAQATTGGAHGMVHNRYIPIEIAAGFDLCVHSSNANNTIYACIEGILIVPGENV